MLCGISSRFQLLSPSERQVAHALLTRPPLSLPSLHPKIPLQSFVRLACVRHAASVRPEPGSNSLKYPIKTAFRLSQSISELFRSFDTLTYHFLLLPMFPSASEITEEYLFTQIISGSFSSLFNFQGSSPSLSRQLRKYTTSFPFCQVLFQTFFVFFLFSFYLAHCTGHFCGTKKKIPLYIAG